MKMSLSALRTLIGCFAIAAIFCSTSNGQVLDVLRNDDDVDPALPTNLFSRYDSDFDLRIESDFYRIGNIWSIGYAFSKKHFVSANAPISYYSKSNKLGIGDMELNYSTMFHLDSLGFLNALGGNISVLLPTGSYEHFMGTGGVRVAPGLIATLRFGRNLFIVPEAYYIFTTEVLQKTEQRPAAPSMHGYGTSVRLVVKPRENMYIWVAPKLESFDLMTLKDEFSLELAYGIKLLNRLGFTALALPNFTTNSFRFQFTNSIFF